MPTENRIYDLVEGSSVQVLVSDEDVESWSFAAHNVDGTAKGTAQGGEPDTPDYAPFTLSGSGTSPYSYTVTTSNDAIYEGPTREEFYAVGTATIHIEEEDGDGTYAVSYDGTFTFRIDDEEDRPKLAVPNLTVVDTTGMGTLSISVPVSATNPADYSYGVKLTVEGVGGASVSRFNSPEKSFSLSKMKTSAVENLSFSSSVAEPLYQEYNVRAVGAAGDGTFFADVAGTLVVARLFTPLNDTVDFNSADAQRAISAMRSNGAEPDVYHAGEGVNFVLLPTVNNHASVGYTLGATFFGGGNVDNIAGADAKDHVVGAGGDDIISGGGGDDTLVGGPGSDTFRGIGLLSSHAESGHNVINGSDFENLNSNDKVLYDYQEASYTIRYRLHPESKGWAAIISAGGNSDTNLNWKHLVFAAGAANERIISEISRDHLGAVAFGAMALRNAFDNVSYYVGLATGASDYLPPQLSGPIKNVAAWFNYAKLTVESLEGVLTASDLATAAKILTRVAVEQATSPIIDQAASTLKEVIPDLFGSHDRIDQGASDLKILVQQGVLNGTDLIAAALLSAQDVDWNAEFNRILIEIDTAISEAYEDLEEFLFDGIPEKQPSVPPPPHPPVSPPDDGPILLGSKVHDVSGPGGQVFALYDGILGRAPDPLGFEHFAFELRKGTSGQDVARALIESSEGQIRVGAQTNEEFLHRLYDTALNRAPDSGGLQHWKEALQAGTSRAEVALGLALSSENIAGLQSAFARGVFVPDKPTADVARLYYGVLDRAPDLGGLNHWVGSLHDGASLTSVAAALIGSDEYEFLTTGQTDQQYIASEYQQILGRAPDPGGEQHWLDALNRGEGRSTVANGLLVSAEFQSRFVGQSNGDYVDGLYLAVFDRSADADGKQGWLGALNSHSMSRTDVALSLVSSPEFQMQHVAPADAHFVELIYEGALGRQSDPGGLQHWTSMLARGVNRADVAVELAESLEAQQHLLGSIELGWHLS